MYDRVIHRDIGSVMLKMDSLGMKPPQPISPKCVAWVLDPSQMCSGRYTLDHVNDQSTKGKRAPSDERHLVTLCEHHHLDYVAGRNWATSHRPELRKYLREVS